MTTRPEPTVMPFKWTGWCNVCDEPTPDSYDSEHEARQMALDCPCGDLAEDDDDAR